ncbi:MAG: dCTP deaminase [Candidatus Heimdallarchaeota archaeon]|nr:dCTP deaminase [Candidatus Heimdallarchaeota archaeon]
MRDSKENNGKVVNDNSKTPVAEVLTKALLLERLRSTEKNKKLYITPLIDLKRQIGESSIDLRLGTEFILFKKANFSIIDPVQTELSDHIGEYQEKVHVKLGEKLILHPGQFVLGSSLEYVSLPNDLLAYVTGRSTWGRLGLVIATATAIHPGFTGVITLELANLGEVPIALYPGVRIAQLIFHLSQIEAEITPSRYYLSVSPTFTKIDHEIEIEVLKKISGQNRSLQ